MAGFETVHGRLRVKFSLPGITKPIREPLGLPATKETKAKAKREILKPLEADIAARNWKAVVARFPDSPRLKALNLVKEYEGTTSLTIPGLLDKVQQDYDRRHFTNAVRFKSTVAHVRKYFEGRLAADFTTQMANDYIAVRQAEGAKDSTINRELSAVIRGFTIAVDEEGLLEKAPYIKKLPENNARKGFFERSLLDAMERYLPAYTHPLVEVAYVTGWRKGELLRLTWRNVDFERGWLRLNPNETKNKKARNFPMTPTLRRILEAQYAYTRQLQVQQTSLIPWVFHRDGERIMDFRKSWDAAVRGVVKEREEQGLSALEQLPLFHDFRRTAVRNLVGAGNATSVAMKLVGWETEAMLRRYLIEDEGMLTDAVERLEVASRAVETGASSQHLANIPEKSLKNAAK
jgi:integrase